MSKLRYFTVGLFLSVAVAQSMQAQCLWTPTATAETTPCNVGIGNATTPLSKLHVIDVQNGNMTFRNMHSAFMNQSANEDDGSAWFGSYVTVPAGATNSGILFGTRIHTFKFGLGNLSNAFGSQLVVGINDGGTIDNAYGATINVWKGAGAVTNGYGMFVESVQATNGYGVFINDVASTNGWGIYQTGANDSNYFAGKIALGTSTPGNYLLDVNGTAHFSGAVTVDGNIAAKYQDVAEWVPATSDMAPGTVVVLNPARANEVMPSSRAYDTAVAGVVSEQPGVILGVAGDSKEQVATTGRVRVKVDATAAPIRIGDLLVSSDKSGIAMKSQPAEVGGVLIHRPGTIIGKALEALPNGEGEILVLLSLQ